jgi:hypothetical protein
MLNYLEKERLKPDSRDARVNAAVHPRRRRRPEVVLPGSSANPTAPMNLFRPDVDRLTPASSGQSTTGSDGQPEVQESNELGKAPSRDDAPRSETTRTVKRRTNTEKANKPLVTGSSGRFRNYSYLGAALDDVPWAPPPDKYQKGLGTDLNPFGTWPEFSTRGINVNELKWSCSRRFGSRSLGEHWVPELLKARHAFLSTIAISSAHDDIVKRALKPPEHRSESFERMTVRHEVTAMINKSMSDPQMQTADATIVAVLHLLNAEIMGCDDDVMRIHQQGLHAMVQQRGGLNELGVSGQLAAIITT